MTDQADRPVSLIEGDRLCVTCAYNLRGQPVYKEAHYGLYLARCPECATPAAIQEYPMLGRWPGRIRVMVALAYAIFAMLLIGMNVLFLGGMTAILAEEGAEMRADQITEDIELFLVNEADAGRDPTKGSTYPYSRDSDGSYNILPFTPIDSTWNAPITLTEPFAERLVNIMREGRNFLGVLSLLYLAAGIGWSVYLLMARRWAIAILMLVIAGVVSGFFILGDLSSQSPGQTTSPANLAAQEYHIPALIVMISVWLTFAGFGIWLGRPIARLFVRAMLPPTMRGSMAELWFTDGKPLPTGTRHVRRLYPESHPKAEGARP